MLVVSLDELCQISVGCDCKSREYADGYMDAVKDMGKALDKLKVIEAEPIRRAEWLDATIYGEEGYLCEGCKCVNDRRTDYCPNCGAKMEVDL